MLTDIDVEKKDNTEAIVQLSLTEKLENKGTNGRTCQRAVQRLAKTDLFQLYQQSQNSDAQNHSSGAGKGVHFNHATTVRGTQMPQLFQNHAGLLYTGFSIFVQDMDCHDSCSNCTQICKHGCRRVSLMAHRTNVDKNSLLYFVKWSLTILPDEIANDAVWFSYEWEELLDLSSLLSLVQSLSPLQIGSERTLVDN